MIAASLISTLWWLSYFSFKPRRMLIASSREGSSTITFWKRRSSALSFSKYFWYSFERGGADRAQFTARERGLQDVRGVHGTIAAARTHQRVDLVDEEHDAALRR